MAEFSSPGDIATGMIKLPNAAQVPYVVIKLPDGTLALRHPNELTKPAAEPAKP